MKLSKRKIRETSATVASLNSASHYQPSRQRRHPSAAVTPQTNPHHCPGNLPTTAFPFPLSLLLPLLLGTTGNLTCKSSPTRPKSA